MRPDETRDERTEGCLRSVVMVSVMRAISFRALFVSLLLLLATLYTLFYIIRSTIEHPTTALSSPYDTIILPSSFLPRTVNSFNTSSTTTISFPPSIPLPQVDPLQAISTIVYLVGLFTILWVTISVVIPSVLCLFIFLAQLVVWFTGATLFLVTLTALSIVHFVMYALPGRLHRLYHDCHLGCRGYTPIETTSLSENRPTPPLRVIQYMNDVSLEIFVRHASRVMPTTIISMTSATDIEQGITRFRYNNYNSI